MNADRLMQRIIAHGADEKGIRDRFGDDAELYALCFQSFMEEPSFPALAAAVAEGNREGAFRAAHALKGVSGNLGVTAFYRAICALVETLRAGGDGNAAAPYAEVRRQYEALARLTGEGGDEPATGEPDKSGEVGEVGETNGANEPAESAASAEPAESTASAKSAETNSTKEPDISIPEPPEPPAPPKDRFLPISVAVILLSFLLVGVLFLSTLANFSRNVILESGRHLVETSNQIKLYVEEYIANDWRIAQSVADSVVGGDYAEGDPALFRLLGRKQASWGVSDLMLYTENGYCVYADGDAESNDVASQTVVMARRLGAYMAVIDSKITYTIPVETRLTYLGSPIVAISVVRDMSSFLDNMHFSPFGGQGLMYLAEDSGVIVSTLTAADAPMAFNFKAIVSGMAVTALDADGDADSLFTAGEARAFMLEDGERNWYAVSAPITTSGMPLRLFYLAPEGAVNRAMNGFSRQLVAFCLLLLAAFAAVMSVAFALAYRSRRKRFNDAIVARERMFDLLSKNTRTAFGLFTLNRRDPVYVSSNAADVLGDPYWAIDKTHLGYRMRNATLVETDALRQVNEALRGWDGRGPFKSGYILNAVATPPYYFELQLYPAGGGGEDFVAIAQDVTQAQAREEATRSAMELAMRSNEAKSRFLSNMSHDIRTPMNAIMNMTVFAMESADQPQKLREYLNTIRDSSRHLLNLINDVLDMSRIESGLTVVESAPFDLRALILRQADTIRPLCEQKKLTLAVDAEGLGAGMVGGDALKLSQILMNLLSNAVKFTPEGGEVRLAARELPSLSADMADVRFTVTDNGIGIAPEDMRHIFEPFARADDRRVIATEGTGLGLSICKSYVDAMGGTLRCHSVPGEGSAFTVELFFRRTDAPPEEEPLPDTADGAPFAGLRCLVVEDNPTNQIIARSLLERLGFAVEAAGNGLEGARAFEASAPDWYDVVYMDIQMPVMNGYRATAQIRGCGHPRAKTVPIVAMSANVFAEDIEKARVAGMDAYVGKPILSPALVDQTRKAIRKERGAQA